MDRNGVLLGARAVGLSVAGLSIRAVVADEAGAAGGGGGDEAGRIPGAAPLLLKEQVGAKRQGATGHGAGQEQERQPAGMGSQEQSQRAV